MSRSPEIRTFSEHKLDQQDPKWRALSGNESVAPTDQEEETGDGPAVPPAPLGAAFRPPSIVTETRIPNVLFRDASVDSYTMIVVQGDDPEVVAGQLAALRRLLIEEERDGGHDPLSASSSP